MLNKKELFAEIFEERQTIREELRHIVQNLHKGLDTGTHARNAEGVKGFIDSVRLNGGYLANALSNRSLEIVYQHHACFVFSPLNRTTPTYFDKRVKACEDIEEDAHNNKVEESFQWDTSNLKGWVALDGVWTPGE